MFDHLMTDYLQARGTYVGVGTDWHRGRDHLLRRDGDLRDGHRHHYGVLLGGRGRERQERQHQLCLRPT